MYRVDLLNSAYQVTGCAGKGEDVYLKEDVSRFNEGDVLVSEMTEPSMVIMMNKAAAIVTDKGGITSHPAIVSRELGIPCVVATKTATRDLKDGVLVRVNGTSGEVVIVHVEQV